MKRARTFSRAKTRFEKLLDFDLGNNKRREPSGKVCVMAERDQNNPAFLRPLQLCRPSVCHTFLEVTKRNDGKSE